LIDDPDHFEDQTGLRAADGLRGFFVSDQVSPQWKGRGTPAANASTRVLEKCGFRHTGTVHDPVDGLVWRWERDPAA